MVCAHTLQLMVASSAPRWKLILCLFFFLVKQFSHSSNDDALPILISLWMIYEHTHYWSPSLLLTYKCIISGRVN